MLLSTVDVDILAKKHSAKITISGQIGMQPSSDNTGLSSKGVKFEFLGEVCL